MFEFILSILGTLGLVSLGWNIYNYIQTKRGFLKLRLECRKEHSEGIDKIICKTYLENTGKSTIRICQAFLFIVKGQVSHEAAVKIICDDMNINCEKSRTSRWKMLSANLNEQNNYIFAGKTTLVKGLSYYYDDNDRLGSLEQLSSTFTRAITERGVYSIYFTVIGERYYKWRPDISHLRIVQDEMLI